MSIGGGNGGGRRKGLKENSTILGASSSKGGPVYVFPIEHYQDCPGEGSVIYSWCYKSQGNLGKMPFSLRKESFWCDHHQKPFSFSKNSYHLARHCLRNAPSSLVCNCDFSGHERARTCSPQPRPSPETCFIWLLLNGAHTSATYQRAGPPFEGGNHNPGNSLQFHLHYVPNS